MSLPDATHSAALDETVIDPVWFAYLDIGRRSAAYIATQLAANAAVLSIWNQTDAATLEQPDTSAVDPGDPVGLLPDLKGAQDFTAPTGQAPLYTDGLTFDGVDDELEADFTGAAGPADASLFTVIKTSDAEAVLYTGEETFDYVGVIQDTGTGSPHANAGSPTYYVNGTALTSPTRDDLHTAVSTGEFEILEVRGADMSGWSKLRLSGYTSLASYRFAGVALPAVLIDNSHADADAARTLALAYGQALIREVEGTADIPVRANTSGTDITPSGSGDPDLDGLVFMGITARFVDVTPVRQKEGGSDTVTASLSGIQGLDDDDLDLLSNPDNWRGRDARLWRIVRNESQEQQGGFHAYYTGKIVALTHAGSSEGQTIRVTIESYLSVFGSPSNRTYLDQEKYDPGDLSARATIAVANGNYTGARTTGGGISGRGGLLEQPDSVAR